jgi:hypothetical protein
MNKILLSHGEGGQKTTELIRRTRDSQSDYLPACPLNRSSYLVLMSMIMDEPYQTILWQQLSSSIFG